MKKTLFLIVAVCLLAVATFAQKNKSYEVPFKMDRNLIIVTGKLNNGAPADFIFDTGTGGIIIGTDSAKKFKLKSKGMVKFKNILKDQDETVESFKIVSLDFNGFVVKNTTSLAVPPENIFSPTAVGIIGLAAFEGNLVTIDYKNSKLIFRKGSLKPNEKTIPISLNPVLEAKIKFNGKEVLAHFDCGSPNFIGIPKQWTDYKVKSEPVLAGKGRTPAGEFEVYRADFDGEIAIGNLKLKDPKVTLLTGNFFAVNLGFQFFNKYLVTIDTRNKLMQIDTN